MCQLTLLACLFVFTARVSAMRLAIQTPDQAMLPPASCLQVDCLKSDACGGGYEEEVLKRIASNGVVTEARYGYGNVSAPAAA